MVLLRGRLLPRRGRGARARRIIRRFPRTRAANGPSAASVCRRKSGEHSTPIIVSETPARREIAARVQTALAPPRFRARNASAILAARFNAQAHRARTGIFLQLQKERERLLSAIDDLTLQLAAAGPGHLERIE